MVEISLLHHVASEVEPRIGPRAEYNTTPDELAKYLRKRQEWKSLPTDSILSHHRSEYSLLVTFDDGYLNNLTEALPVLECYNATAIIFITTGFVSGDVYPYELELASVVAHYDSLYVESDSRPVRLKKRNAKAKLYQQLRHPLKTKSHQVRENYLNKLSEMNDHNRLHFQRETFLSWEEIAELDRHPLVTVGAHTHAHPVLTRRAPWTAYHEMKKSKRTIEEVVGHPVRHFSYPYGRNNFVVRFLARRAGFRWAFTTEARCPEDIGDCDPMALPRSEIQDLL